MLRKKFAEHLELVSERILKYTKTLVTNELPSNFKYIVSIYSNWAVNLEEDEFLYPENEDLNQTTQPIFANEVIDLLWIEGKVPEWIDFYVYDIIKNNTVFYLDCCPRFSENRKHLYHIQEGNPPFHGTSPPLPPFALNEDLELVKKFDIGWNRDFRKNEKGN